LSGFEQSAHIRGVDIAAILHHRAERIVRPFDIEQRKVRLVFGHEPHACFGPLADAGDGVCRRIHRAGLRASKVEAHRAHQLREQ